MFLAPAPPACGLPPPAWLEASGLAEALKANLVASTISSRGARVLDEPAHQFFARAARIDIGRIDEVAARVR